MCANPSMINDKWHSIEIEMVLSSQRDQRPQHHRKIIEATPRWSQACGKATLLRRVELMAFRTAKIATATPNIMESVNGVTEPKIRGWSSMPCLTRMPPLSVPPTTCPRPRSHTVFRYIPRLLDIPAQPASQTAGIRAHGRSAKLVSAAALRTTAWIFWRPCHLQYPLHVVLLNPELPLLRTDEERHLTRGKNQCLPQLGKNDMLCFSSHLRKVI